MILVPDITPPFELAGIAWPPPHQKLTREGTCWFREVGMHVGNEGRMLGSWKKNKRQWMERGFSLRKVQEKWYAQQWLVAVPTGGYALTAIGEEKLNGFDTPQQSTMEIKQAPQPAIVLPDLHSAIVQKLLAYQVDPAKQIYRALKMGKEEWGYPGAVDLSEVGVGKTYMDLAAAIATGREIVVLCPVVGEPGWRRACAHFGIEPLFITTYEATRGGWRPHIVKENPDGTFTWSRPNDIIIILDEAQAVRHDTLTTRCCAGAVRQGIPIIVASATIALTPLEMRFAARVTGLHKGAHDWDRFLTDHGCHQMGGSWKWNQKDHHLVRIHHRLFPHRGARVRREDLGDACPETIISTLPFDVPEAAQIEQDWRATQEFLDRMAKQGGGRSIAMMERQARMKVWKRCENVLVRPLALRIRQDVANGKSVVVFMNFNESRIALSKLLGTSAGFYGGQPGPRRKYYESEFQADRQHILVNNLGAGGASVSLHDVRGERPRRAYILISDDAIKIAQSLGRVDRVGSKSVSEQFLCYIKGAQTEIMVRRTRMKIGRLAKLNDGDLAKGSLF